MRICIIAEGCYPYVVGGVSSWVQNIIKSLPEKEFSVIAINAHRKSAGKFHYELPENLVEIKEIFLDKAFEEEKEWGKKINLRDAERDVLLSLIKGEAFDWSVLFEFLDRNRKLNASTIIKSKTLLDLIMEAYTENKWTVSFTDFFWTVRSILVPMLYLLKQDFPDADVYHSVSTGYAGLIGSKCKYMKNKPFIITEHGIYTREREEEIIKADWVRGAFKNIWINFFYNLSGCAYQYADKVISLFEGSRKIQIELGCDENKTQVIKNGVDFDVIKTRIRPKKEEGYLNVGAIIRVVPIKDIKTMIYAFNMVEKNMNNVRFHIMGPYDEETEYYRECLELAKTLNIRNIKFYGNVNIAEHINDMDLLVLSSISEGQPLAVLEGMAFGKPHVATNVGSIKELLYGEEDDFFGEAGIVVPAMDYTKLAEEIMMLLKNESLRKKMGEVAQRRIDKYYRIQDVINNYRNLYEHFGGI